MSSSKLIKSPKLGIVLQLTQVPAKDAEGRAWEVHDVERNRGFRVTLSGKALRETPSGRTPLRRELAEAEIEGALGLAIEHCLVAPPEKVPGQVYDLQLTSGDLYDFVQPRA